MRRGRATWTRASSCPGPKAHRYETESTLTSSSTFVGFSGFKWSSVAMALKRRLPHIFVRFFVGSSFGEGQHISNGDAQSIGEAQVCIHL